MSKCIGWREWVSLPGLGIKRIKAKVDTGAKTSSIHARDIEVFKEKNTRWVRFRIYASPAFKKSPILAQAKLVDYRRVKSSSGHVSQRPVIRTVIMLSDRAWLIELTLTNRAEMGFPMLLGREAIKKRFLVDPDKSFLQGRP